MIKRFSIANLWLGITMLCAMMFQSFHAMEHLVEHFNADHCHHQYHIGKTEVGHAHHDLETCFSCEFTFSHFTAVLAISFQPDRNADVRKPLLLHYCAALSVFNGSMVALRGPPGSTVANFV